MGKTAGWTAPLISGGMVLLLAGLGAALFFQWRAAEDPGTGRRAEPVARDATLAVATGANEAFTSVTWKGRIAGGPEARAKALAAAVGQAEGPDGEPLWPAPVRVRNVYLRPEGLLILDLDASITYNAGHDAAREWRLVRSLTRTLIQSSRDIERIKFLVNGAEAETLAGHINIAMPFGPADVTP